MRKIFEVSVYKPLAPRERLHTCITYTVLAASEEGALAVVGKTLERLRHKYLHMTIHGHKDDDGVSPVVMNNRFSTCTKQELAQLMGLPLSESKEVVRKLSDKALGATQLEVLKSLRSSPYPKGGWVWGTHSGTVAIVESLYARMLVDKVNGQYVISAEGLKTLENISSFAKQQRIDKKISRSKETH